MAETQYRGLAAINPDAVAYAGTPKMAFPGSTWERLFARKGGPWMTNRQRALSSLHLDNQSEDAFPTK